MGHRDRRVELLQHELDVAERRRARFARTAVVLACVSVVGIALIAWGLSAGARAEQRVNATATASESRPSATTGAEADTKEYSAPEKGSGAPTAKEPEAKQDPQSVSIAIGQRGYEPSQVTVKEGAPVELVVARGEGCAAGFLIPELDVAADNSQGPATVELGRLKRGTYRFTCGMQMVEGTLVVQ